MRVLVTGAAGFLGSWLVERLVGEGHGVYGEDDFSRVDNFWSLVEPLCDKFYEGTEDPGLVDFVFHLASPCGVRNIDIYTIQGILDSTRYALSAAQKSNCPLVAFSTSEVLGRWGEVDEDSDIHIHPQSMDIRSQYQVGKLAAECLLLSSDHQAIQIIRPFNVVGPRQSRVGGFVLPRFVEAVQKGEPLPLFGNGHQRREFLSVHDVVDFCMMLLDREVPLNKGVWHLGNPDNRVSIMELATLVVAAHGKGSVQYVDPNAALGMTGYRDTLPKFADISKARGLGWEPKRGLGEIVREVLSATSVRREKRL